MISDRLHRCLATVAYTMAACALSFAAIGCEAESLEFTEVKRLDELVTEQELQTFLRIVKALPDEKLPTLPAVFAPPPDWNPSRTLPVSELVTEERTLLDQHWSVDWQARLLKKNRGLQRILRRERLTTEQFVGLAMTIGVSLARSTLHERQDLDDVVRTGQRTIDELLRDDRPFSSLTREGRHHALQQATWITRVDRASRLMLVPPENLALVEAHREELAAAFPAEFTSNPLDAVVDRLGELGLPFEELADSGYDDAIEWNAETAIVGHDPPEGE